MARFGEYFATGGAHYLLPEKLPNIFATPLGCYNTTRCTRRLGCEIVHRVSRQVFLELRFWIGYGTPQVSSVAKALVHLYPSKRHLRLPSSFLYSTAATKEAARLKLTPRIDRYPEAGTLVIRTGPPAFLSWRSRNLITRFGIQVFPSKLPRVLSNQASRKRVQQCEYHIIAHVLQRRASHIGHIPYPNSQPSLLPAAHPTIVIFVRLSPL